MESEKEVQGIIKDTQAYVKSKIAALANANAPSGLIQDFSKFCSSLEDTELMFIMLEKIEDPSRKNPKDILEFLQKMKSKNRSTN